MVETGGSFSPKPPKESGGLLLAPIKATGFDSDPTYRYLARLDTEAEDTEASRLLYVAATRAENRLHLLACLGGATEGDVKRSTAHTLLSRAWSAAEPFFQTKHKVDPHAVPAREIYSISRLPSGFQLPSLPKQVEWSAPPEGRDEDGIEFSWAGETARHVGNVVHRWLKRIAQDETKGWDAKTIDRLAGIFRRELQRRGVRNSDSYVAAQLVRTALKNTLADERGRWILGTHTQGQSEARLRVRAGRALRTYIIDRVFRDAEGYRWVVDFKTSRHEGAGLEAFLDEERKRYETQLNNYARAFDQARLGLYFPMLRGWREWTR